MSLISDQLSEIMDNQRLQEEAPALFAFYRSEAVCKLRGLIKEHAKQHSPLLTQLKPLPGKKFQIEPHALILLQELARPAALSLECRSKLNSVLSPVISKDALGHVQTSRRQHFNAEVAKQKGRSAKEVELAGLLYLARTIHQYSNDFQAYNEPAQPAPLDQIKTSFITTVADTLRFDSLEALFSLPIFQHPNEARLKLRTQLDESFCIYSAVKCMIMNQALLVFHAALKEEALKRRLDAIQQATDKFKPALEKEYLKAQSNIDENIREKLKNTIEAARENGWNRVDFTELSNLQFTSSGTRDRVNSLIETLKNTDNLEMDPELSGFEAAIKLEQMAPSLRALPKSLSNSSELIVAHSPRKKQAGYFWQLSNDLKAYHTNSASFFKQVILRVSSDARDFHEQKTLRMKQILQKVSESLHPDLPQEEDQLTQKLQDLKALLKMHLKQVILDEKKHNPIRGLLGETSMVTILKNAIDYLEKTARVEALPEPHIPKSISPSSRI